MKITECMIAWNKKSKDVRVDRWPDHSGWSDRYTYTGGACEARVHRMTPDQRERLMFIMFNTIVVRDGCDPMAAHEAFLNIDEYRSLISPDTPGADVPPDYDPFVMPG